MKARWFMAVVLMAAAPFCVAQQDLGVYKKVGDNELHMFYADAVGKRAFSNPSPAIVYFFGGGWNIGKPGVEIQAKMLNKMGLPVFHPDYRVKTRQNSVPTDSMADAADAVRWIREHAKEYNIDPDRLIFSGYSAGGHLAATLPISFDGKSLIEAPSEFKPWGLILFSPVVDATPNGYQGKHKEFLAGEVGKGISPVYHLYKGYPRALIFQGDQDTAAKYANAVMFSENMTALGNDCNLQVFVGGTHFMNLHEGENLLRLQKEVKAFLGLDEAN